MQVPIAISWFFNGNLIWHLVNEAKTVIMVTQNRLLLQKMPKNTPKMAQTLHLRPGNGSPSFTPSVWPLWNAFVALWYPKLSWNVPKTLKPYISVWPKATGPCFDVLVLIWIPLDNMRYKKAIQMLCLLSGSKKEAPRDGKGKDWKTLLILVIETQVWVSVMRLHQR